MSSLVQRLLSPLRKSTEGYRDDIKKEGIDLHADLALAPRHEIMLREIEGCYDRRLDADDREAKMNGLIWTVAVPWLRVGSNSAAGKVFIAWKKLHAEWINFSRMMRLEYDSLMVKVEVQVEAMAYSSKEPAKTARREIWVRPSTYVTLRAQGKCAEALEIAKIPGMPVHGTSRRGFSPQEVDFFVELMCDTEFLPWGEMILAASFVDEDITPQRVTVIQSSMMPGAGYNSSMVPTSSFSTGGRIRHPDDRSVPGVVETS